MSLRDLKIPKLKFKKMKMNLEELENIDYKKLEKKDHKKRSTPYEDSTHYNMDGMFHIWQCYVV